MSRSNEESKASGAFRTIAEVADELEVPKHVLRFWEGKFNQVRPMKRGGGRRFYRPEDVDLLRGIQHLLHAEGYTIRGVQKILRRQGVDVVKVCWRKGAAVPRPEAGGGDDKEPAAPAAAPVVRGRKASATAAALDGDRAKALRGVLTELEAVRAILAGPRAKAQRALRAGRA